MELPKNTDINKYAIKLINSKQSFYGSIYALNLEKLETLKVYIKTHLKTGFVWPWKSPTDTFILFDEQPDGNFYLCINY